MGKSFINVSFIVGIIFQLQKLLQVYVKNTKTRYFGLLLILADPTMLASFVLVNPETIIIFFFLLAVNGILYHQKKWKFLGLLFLSIITFRSMMLFAGIFLFQMLQSLIIHRKKLPTNITSKNIIHLPSSFVAWSDFCHLEAHYKRLASNPCKLTVV